MTRIRFKTKEEFQAEGRTIKDLPDNQWWATSKEDDYGTGRWMAEVWKHLREDQLRAIMSGETPSINYKTTTGITGSYVWHKNFFVEEKGCDCGKEKHGFLTHERWCHDYKHPLAEDKQAPVKSELEKTEGGYTSNYKHISDFKQQRYDTVKSLIASLTVDQAKALYTFHVEEKALFKELLEARTM